MRIERTLAMLLKLKELRADEIHNWEKQARSQTGQGFPMVYMKTMQQICLMISAKLGA
jgi:hypothetical protein